MDSPSPASVVVADANALLAIVIGKAASKVLLTEIGIHTTEFTWAEMDRHLDGLCAQYGEDPLVLRQVLPYFRIVRHSKPFYSRFMRQASVLMEEKDPDDVELAALALKLKAPIWSNDNHFRNFVTGRYTTAQLLKACGF